MQQVKLVLLRLDYLLGAAIIICQVSGRFTLTSAIFYATFCASFLLWLLTLTEKVEALDLFAFLIILIAFVNIVLNGIQERADFSFNYFKKYIMFCCTIAFFAAAIKIKIEKKTAAFLEFLFVCISFFLIFMYITQNASMHLLNGCYVQYLTFRFTNPNLTALFLSCIIMYLVATSFQEKHLGEKCLLLGLAAVEGFFLFETQARNALFAIAAFLCFFVRLIIKKEKPVINKWLLWLISIIPILFAFAYMKTINTSVIKQLLSFVVSEGKNLDSRWLIWNRAIAAFAASPILGAYCQVSNGTGSFQLHNTHIDTLTAYGAVVLVFVCIFLYRIMLIRQSTTASRRQMIYLVGFICTVFLGIGEAAMFSGGLGVYLFAGVFLLIHETNADTELITPMYQKL